MPHRDRPPLSVPAARASGGFGDAGAGGRFKGGTWDRHETEHRDCKADLGRWHEFGATLSEQWGMTGGARVRENDLESAFCDMAIARLREPLAELGVHETRRGDQEVTFASSDAQLTLGYDARTGEIDVEIAYMRMPNAPILGLWDLARVLPTGSIQELYQTNDVQQMRECVEQIAMTLLTHGSSLLLAETDVVNTVLAAVGKLRADETRKATYLGDRMSADQAWRRRDYQEAARLYESLGETLSPLERARLKHATTRA